MNWQTYLKIGIFVIVLILGLKWVSTKVSIPVVSDAIQQV